MNKKWQCYETNNEEVKKIQDKYKISKIIATILENRNIKEEEQIRKFLSPTREDFYDPFEMPDMQKAVNRICEAIEKQ